MDEPEEICSKVQLEDGRTLYFSVKEIKEESSKRLWEIILTDGSRVWTSEVSEDILSDLAHGSSYSAQQFIELFRSAFNLRSHESGTILKYTLTAMSAGKDCFFWSIYLPKDDKTFRLGGIDVRPLKEEAERGAAYCRMFNSLLFVSNECRKKAETSHAHSEEERKVSQAALQKLEKLVAVQEQCEQVLYTNFVAVLNEKKRMIRELQDKCEALKESIDSPTAPASVAVETVTVPKRGGRGKAARGGAARGGGARTVSACKAPASRRLKSKKALDYDSDNTLEEEEEMSQLSEVKHSSKRVRKFLQSSDEDATDVDEPDAVSQTSTPRGSFTLSEAPTMACETATAATIAPTQPRPESTLELKPTSAASTSNPPPGSPPLDNPPLDNPPLDKPRPEKVAAGKRSAGDELDDLLGESSGSSATVKKSSIKRKPVQKAAPAPTRARPARRSKANKSASVDDNSIDGLLDGL